MGERAPSGAVVQIVRPAEASARRSTRLGLGLLVSLVVGWPGISAGLDGSVPFEGAVVRFLLAVAVSVAAVLALGGLYDHLAARAEAPRRGADGDGTPRGAAEVAR